MPILSEEAFNALDKYKLNTKPGVDKVKPKVWFKYSFINSFYSPKGFKGWFYKIISYKCGLNFFYPGCRHFHNGSTSKILSLTPPSFMLKSVQWGGVVAP